jgi:trehalose synthase
MAASLLEQYEDVVGPQVMQELRVVADHVGKQRLQNINSTPVGGGVAELLARMVPLLRELGVETSWDVIKGNQAFFHVTKAFHNALHGKSIELTEHMLDAYRETTETNLREMNFTGDVIWIHDPQPAGLIAAKKKIGRRWVWRCHIDVSSPNPRVWKFLQPYVEQYDAAIFSMPNFAQQLNIPQFMVTPSIDPLSDKNRDLEERQIDQVATKYHLDRDRPILTQISRFDRLKDPLGVIAAYRLVKSRRDCQLILAGGGAPDDPEGFEVLQEVQAAAGEDPDIHILLLPDGSDIEINALVRASTVVFQKSIREGFGLTVTEALWKKKPVIGGDVGGIRLQILNGTTGYLVHSPEGAALRTLQLLSDAELRRRMGENGYQHVKQNFLLTRDVKDHLLVMLALAHPDEDVVHAD